MLVFECRNCRKSLSATEEQVGSLVQCPNCHRQFRVPGEAPVSVPVGAAAENEMPLETTRSAAPRQPATPPPSTGFRRNPLPKVPPARSSVRTYGFNCAYCSSRLEATAAMAAQEGQCPTCGNNITIPILDRAGRLIDPKTNKIIKQDPHPVHAYAAAGERAPRIVRKSDSVQLIQCQKCDASSPITANNCHSCGMPFTMEGTTIDPSGASNSFCVASLVIGIIALPTSPMLITPMLALIFGFVGLSQVKRNAGSDKGSGIAVAGMILGGITMLMGVWFDFVR